MAQLPKFSLIIILVLCVAFPVLAQELAPSADYLTVSVIILGRNVPIYSWWGHIGIIVRDARANSVSMYGYGNFSFESKNFYSNFAFGRLWFMMLREDARRYISYSIRENRDVRIYDLDLSLDARKKIVAYLEWNDIPENRLYLYHHFKDNCSTRIRDIIDAATGGALKRQASRDSGFSFRQWARFFMDQNEYVDALLNFLLSGVNDKSVSTWDAMYLPEVLEREMMDLRYLDAAGQERPLVASMKEYHTSTTLKPVTYVYSSKWYLGFIAGIVAGILAAGLMSWNRFTQSKLATVFSLSFQVLTAIIAGLLGSVLFFMMAFTNHEVTFWNMNLFMANPLVFLFFPLLFIARRKNREDKLLIRSRFWAFFLLASLVSIPVNLISGFRQENVQALCFFLPLYAGLAFPAILASGPRPAPRQP